jgi:hypothetical protein
MPGKMARSDPRPSFGLPDLLVAIHTSRQSCSKAGKAQMFALVWESSGESRLSWLSQEVGPPLANSRHAAETLCSRLRAVGGSCLVQRN